MDSKITLSFDKNVIEKAKKYAQKNNISLSRMIELLLDQITSHNYKTIEDFPVADWVNKISDGKATYKTKSKSRSQLKNEYYSSKK